MTHYIDAEKLIAEINKRLMAVNLEKLGNFGSHRVWAYNDVKDMIDSLQQEQPEVDLEKVLSGFTGYYAHENSGEYPSAIDIARHFYGLRNRALEEAALHVHESWMGGTMDDVRRDMVELGRVINARKED